MTEEGKNLYFVRELKSGYVALGDVQRFEGCALLLCREHKTELHHLTPENRTQFLSDMALVAEAVDPAFRPDAAKLEELKAALGSELDKLLAAREA